MSLSTMTLHGRTQYSDCGDKNCDVAWDLCGVREQGPASTTCPLAEKAADVCDPGCAGERPR